MAIKMGSESYGCQHHHFYYLLQQNLGKLDILVPAYPGCRGNLAVKNKFGKGEDTILTSRHGQLH